MIIFISAILYTVQLIVEPCNCLYLIDLPQGREAYSAKWRLGSRASEMYEIYPKKRGMKSYLRRYMLGNDRPGDKILSKASRRVYEDEKDANIKNKIKTLLDHAVQDTQDRMKELDEIKAKYKTEKAYKAGFILGMVKKSREVLNELFNVAIKHRDEWQALEQLKIFEMIVNTNIDTNHLLKQLLDLQAGRDVDIDAKPGKGGKVDPSAKKADDPKAKPADDPNAKPPDDPKAKPDDDPNAKPPDDPIAKPGDDPNAKPPDDPIAKPGDDPNAKPPDDPIAKPGDDPNAKPPDDPTAKKPDT